MNRLGFPSEIDGWQESHTFEDRGNDPPGVIVGVLAVGMGLLLGVLPFGFISVFVLRALPGDSFGLGPDPNWDWTSPWLWFCSLGFFLFAALSWVIVSGGISCIMDSVVAGLAWCGIPRNFENRLTHVPRLVALGLLVVFPYLVVSSMTNQGNDSSGKTHGHAHAHNESGNRSSREEKVIPFESEWSRGGGYDPSRRNVSEYRPTPRRVLP